MNPHERILSSLPQHFVTGERFLVKNQHQVANRTIAPCRNFEIIYTHPEHTVTILSVYMFFRVMV